MLGLNSLRSYSGLLASFLVLMLVDSIQQYLGTTGWLIEVAMVGVLIFAINTVTGDRQGGRVVLFFGLPAVIGALLVIVLDLPAFFVALTLFLKLAFLIAVIAVILRNIMGSDRVTADTLLGAVCVYVLLGIVWAIAYGLLLHLNPNAFSLAGHFAQHDSDLALQLYYSFVTLTTLGFGDISPISPMARTLTILEALTGQIYLALTIARLVSLYIADREPRKS